MLLILFYTYSLYIGGMLFCYCYTIMLFCFIIACYFEHEAATNNAYVRKRGHLGVESQRSIKQATASLAIALRKS